MQRSRRERTLLLVWLLAGLATVASRPVASASQSPPRRTPIFEPIDGPQAKATIASAINVHGEIVGQYTDQRDRSPHPPKTILTLRKNEVLCHAVLYYENVIDKLPRHVHP